MAGTPQVRAAGGVVTRLGDGDALEFLVVHRPRYDDWSLPKGKLEAGESGEDAARREVAEETGLICALGTELTTCGYVDRNGRLKSVRYWSMTVTGSEPWEPNHEIDATRWISAAEAATLLTYEHDRHLIAEVDAAHPGGRQ